MIGAGAGGRGMGMGTMGTVLIIEEMEELELPSSDFLRSANPPFPTSFGFNEYCDTLT